MVKKQVGFVGWRGMVGSVLIRRMCEQKDFDQFDAVFFTTSQQGQKVRIRENQSERLEDAYDLEKLIQMDMVVTCQGSEYSEHMLPKLRSTGWQGFWIDAASHYRMADNSVIVLDPINHRQIDQALNRGIKNFIGGNCTVSLMMLAIQGLLQENLVDWISVMSYQAVSGAGAQAMTELVEQMASAGVGAESEDSLALEQSIRSTITQTDFPCTQFMTPMAYNILPFIDVLLANGQSKEEWKAEAEMNKMLASTSIIPVDGICVRVPVLRAHSQALTIQLNKSLDLQTIEDKIKSANKWVRFVENTPAATALNLTPISVSNTLDIAVGRLKRTTISDRHIQLFTVGDQLLWGAAEPLRRMLNICLTRD